MDFSGLSLAILLGFACMSVGVGSITSPASDSSDLVSGCLSPFAYLVSGCLSPSVAMHILLCLSALAIDVVVGSLHDNEPMQADEPPIVRGDAPPGMFTPRWNELQQLYGIERLRGSQSAQAAPG